MVLGSFGFLFVFMLFCNIVSMFKLPSIVINVLLLIIGVVELFVIMKMDGYSREKYKKYRGIMIFAFITTALIYFFITKFWIVAKDAWNSGLFSSKITLFLLSLVIMLIISPAFTKIFQKYYENKVTKKYEKKFKIQEYEYYRDLLKDVPPAILSYCISDKINIEDATIATLLNLELNGYIKIKDNRIIKLKNIDDLSNHENLVLDQITSNKFSRTEYKKEFKHVLINDMIVKKYIKAEHTANVNITYFMEMIMAWMIVYLLSTITMILRLSEIGIINLVTYAATFAVVPIYKFIQSKIKVLYKNEIALEMRAKIVGLKNYIEDFSNIKDKNIDQVKLYDSYLIYAIIMNIKGKLDNESMKLYKNIKKEYLKNNITVT